MTGQSSSERAALVVLFVSAATLGGAWVFEYGLGYEPCPLCLEQRWPYYFGIPLAFMAYLALASGQPRPAAIGLAGFAVLFAYGTGLGAYHSGIEWGWWTGPADCAPSTGLETDASRLMESFSTSRPPSCTDAAWRFAGLSLAGYNAIISAALTVVAAIGGWQALQTHRRSGTVGR